MGAASPESASDGCASDHWRSSHRGTDRNWRAEPSREEAALMRGVMDPTVSVVQREGELGTQDRRLMRASWQWPVPVARCCRLKHGPLGSMPMYPGHLGGPTVHRSRLQWLTPRATDLIALVAPPERRQRPNGLSPLNNKRRGRFRANRCPDNLRHVPGKLNGLRPGVDEHPGTVTRRCKQPTAGGPALDCHHMPHLVHLPAKA